MIYKHFYLLAGLLFLSFTFSGCVKNEIVVPGLTPEPTNEQLVGKFVWFDLFTHDIQKTTSFYQGVFGWTFVDTAGPDNPVKTIRLASLPIANAVELTTGKDGGESTWLSYMSVPDADMAATLVKDLNGTLYKKTMDLPNRGRIVIAIDPEGAIFGMVSSPTGDPPDLSDRENNFIGAELWTSDTESAINLYKALAGYRLESVEVGNGGTYNLLTRDTMPRAGVVKIPWDDVKPNWIPYIGVRDLALTIARVEKLGGSLLIKPPAGKFVNPLAIAADPTGAVFGIQQIEDIGSAAGDMP